ncbi:L,D-transpeptidase family protein [Microbulbifer hydrolyticus]|uniref:L,D-transpeptidase family protein n=1 Tax=Microbulbifer hydrolyticus TaxID=48074 RepID=A0A6P1T5P6_9GAMM|nr:L,D-transpeptidase family protein [Microbulbifer hydrolyticus]MBB5211164.1 murein L,D-transpeptidase YcbB/YkuD [Microbulbifer hydrolyticus]QHQ38058.1 L,D-transpeptidase family protein [Microbulbifer hydrolyticus]
MGNRPGIQSNLSAAVVLSISLELVSPEAASFDTAARTAANPRAATPQSEQQLKNTGSSAVTVGQADASEFATVSGSYSPFTPYGRQYALMREELARYRALSEGDHWQPLPEKGQTLAPGVRDPRVKILRSLLMQYGDLPTTNDMTTTQLRGDGKNSKGKAAPELYDSDVRHAVERFQRRHGLRADGIVDRATREQLNTPPARRLATLEANLDRWEKMPKDLGPRHIVVNIPDYTLRLIEGEREQYRMRVVVGKSKHPTPQLSTRMTRVVFNPTWTVPINIAVRELLPKGTATLAAGGYRLVNNRGKSVAFSGRNLRALRLGSVALQQRGGEGNALGRFKFVIPNQQAIFLHDTQRKELFSRSTRAFSHGCIRLEKPQELAEIVLADQGSRPGKWNAERLTRYTSGTRTRAVALDQPIPVHIVYWTAWVDEEGLLNFRPDIYDRDQPADSKSDTSSNGPQSDSAGE